MSRYILYTDEFNRFLAEVLDEGIDNLYEVEKELTEKGLSFSWKERKHNRWKKKSTNKCHCGN